jgi:uncharacterized protein YoxC
MSGGEIAGLIAAFVFAVLVALLAIPLIKLGKVLDETRHLVAGVGDKTVPLLGEVTTSVTQVNVELQRVDAIAANAQSISGNMSALTSLFAATLGGPVVKVAAFSYGVRKAAGARSRSQIERQVKETAKAERAASRAARRSARGKS